MKIMSQEQTMGYDRATVTFSPDGRIFQVEYAKETVKKGSTIVGVVGKDCVVLGAIKKTSKLVKTGDKLFKIDNHIGAAATGYLADARVLVDVSRIKAQQSIMVYDEPIRVQTLAKDIADRKQMYTQHGGIRPYGIAFLIAGVDNNVAKLFETNPSGLLLECLARASGQNQDKINKYFETHYKNDMTEKEAVKLAVNGIKLIFSKDNDNSSIDKDNNEIRVAVINKNGYREFEHK
jgi:proteasome alpha subunit